MERTDILSTSKGKEKNDIVPTNSPITATVCPRVVGGRRLMSDLRGPEAEVGAWVFIVGWQDSLKGRWCSSDGEKGESRWDIKDMQRRCYQGRMRQSQVSDADI